MATATVPVSAFTSALIKAAADLHANRPLPSRPAFTGAEIASILRAIQTRLPQIIAVLDAHPGIITALGDILDALDKAGFSWAATIEEIVEAAPASITSANDAIPWILPMLTAFAPAATGITGDMPPGASFRPGRG